MARGRVYVPCSGNDPRGDRRLQRSWHVARLDDTAGDAVLVDLAREGDGAAFELLVRRYTRPAYAIALAVVKEPADAEDVCQDAFIRALERLEDCEPERFGAWVLRIVRNRAHSVRRYLGVRDASPLDTLSLASTRPGPSRETERSQLRSDLRDALAELKEVQRQIVLLHDLEGWKHREIGELLDMPVGTVRAHLFHARRALREHEALKRARNG
jgi:RNA polymerase sigma-70 factor, ECF subfamily